MEPFDKGSTTNHEQPFSLLTPPEFLDRLAASENAINDGRVISQEDLEKEAKNW